jgi:hypothetical protein
MNNLDHIFLSLETIFWVKILKFYDADAEPGSGIRDTGICLTLDPGWKIFVFWIPDPQPGIKSSVVKKVKKHAKVLEPRHKNKSKNSKYYENNDIVIRLKRAWRVLPYLKNSIDNRCFEPDLHGFA